MERGIENEFARLESRYDKKEDVQTAQATVDLKLFLKKYLSIDIDGNGNAPTTDARPSAPVTFCRWRLHNKELPKVVFSKASGFHMKEFSRFTIIGWDAAKVDAEIARLQDENRRKMEQEEAAARTERERKEAEKKARWKRRCKGHDELATKQQRRPSPLGLKHLPGSYLVQWHSKEAGDLNDPHHESKLMKINIFPPTSSHGVKASFCFGGVEGTMLLAMSRRAVELLREEQPKHRSYSEDQEDEDDYGDDDGHDVLAGDDVHGFLNIDVKFKTKLTGEKRSLGDISDPYGVLAARAKRQKADAPQQEALRPNRVYFLFVCNEVDGYPIVDDRNEHIGHLDFDQTGLAAKGVFDVPRKFGKAQSISIFKISEEPEPDKKPEPWYRFDGRSWRRW